MKMDPMKVEESNIVNFVSSISLKDKIRKRLLFDGKWYVHHTDSIKFDKKHER